MQSDSGADGVTRGFTSKVATIPAINAANRQNRIAVIILLCRSGQLGEAPEVLSPFFTPRLLSSA